MDSNGYVLAMYDVRGKQDFIYRSRKCKEIVGGSHIIADVFKDYLYPAAEQYCGRKIYTYAKESVQAEQFCVKTFAERMEEGTYIGEVVYEGGGNFLVLYRDAATCIGVNKIFTRTLLEKIGTLKVLCTYIDQLDFDNYAKDQKRLYDRHRITEAQESTIFPVNTLPFVEVSPVDSRPYTARISKGNKTEMVTTEQKAKYDKYEEYLCQLKEEDEFDKEEFLLDALVTEKGRESLLAVIYIDGNSMGAKVQACLQGRHSYDECVTRLREFSDQIDKNYVKDRLAAINTALLKKYEGRKEKVRRTIVAAGDEMTIICNARDALDVAKAYFRGLSAGNSSCAGVAVFHSHAPYADAYRIAEECCESGKKKMKEAGVTNCNLLDFHYCQGSIGISLKNIRRAEGLNALLSKPWRISMDKNGASLLTPIFSVQDFEGEETNLVGRMAMLLNRLGHSNVKVLRQAAQAGSAELEMELERIKAHNDPTMDFSLGGLLDEERRRRLIYDIVVMYDLWFWRV